MNRVLHFMTNGSGAGSWAAMILVRLLVGWIFILAGLEKFMDLSAAGERFGQIGFPAPGFTAGFVGFFEFVCGSMVLLGLLTRGAAVPLAIIMIVALLTTKVPQFTNGELIDALRASRLDVSLLLANLYLLIAGGGRLAVDRFIHSPRESSR